MSPLEISTKIEEVVRNLRQLDWDEHYEDDLESSITDLEILSEDLQAEETEKLVAIERGRLAFCLFCGGKFHLGLDHSCPQLLTRGTSCEESIRHRDIQEEVPGRTEPLATSTVVLDGH